MKSMFAAFVVAALSSLAHANGFELIPGEPGGPDFADPRRELCQGVYRGTWEFRGGVPMQITLQRRWRDSVLVTVQTRRGRETVQGTCFEDFRGAQVSFNSGNVWGDLDISRRGKMQGDVSGHPFWGRLSGGGGPRPDPRPRPGPGGDRCNGRIDGTWGFKGGRPMTLTVSRTWGDQVTVVVSTRNGAEQTQGHCVQEWNGVTRIQFQGSANSGNVQVDQNGQVSGIVSGYGFSGIMN